jgi:SAM-dependent methyltransferase
VLNTVIFSIPGCILNIVNNVVTKRTSFDLRVVRYEEIHSIRSDDFRAFVNAAMVSGKCRILDCGCGYGAVTREILLATEQGRLAGELQVSVDLIDESTVQLDRAKTELQRWLHDPATNLRFITGIFPDDLDVFSEPYDVIACKMVLHEVRQNQQPMFLRQLHECLKPGGRLILWDVCLSSDIASFYRSVVRSKDALAGYATMVERRNFLTEDEIKGLFEASPFGYAEFVRNILYRFDTMKRFIPEFKGDSVRFAQWQDFIRKSASAIDPSILAAIHYCDEGDSIAFDIRKVIVRGIRSES